MTSFRPKLDDAWNYLRPIAGREQYMRFIPCGPEAYELVILDGLPSKVVSNSDDPPKSFHTSDTWTPHPSIPNAWKYLGRIDDRITLVNGEKCLPIPFEHLVRESDLVQECWMFGIGRVLPGIMIVLSEQASSLTKEEVFDRIWPSIERANARVERFSQVSKQMVEILPIGTEYPTTDKGTMIRARTYKEFASQIDSVYDMFDRGLTGDEVHRLVLDFRGLQNYLLHAFRHRIGITEVCIDTDLFTAGVDSLQAISVRGMINREVDLGSGELRQNVVFENPSIKSLAAHLYALRTGEDGHTKDELAIMADLIKKYSHFPKHEPGITTVESECIVRLLVQSWLCFKLMQL
jgi:Phosphopantetheine attachment site